MDPALQMGFVPQSPSYISKQHEEGASHAHLKLPLSGDVVQSINPWTAFLSPIGSQFGLIHINLGQSSAPAVEEVVLSDVGSYGKQLGRIGDALIVLLAHFHPRTPLSADETEAIDALKDMLAKIADIKAEHARPAVRPDTAAAT